MRGGVCYDAVAVGVIADGPPLVDVTDLDESVIIEVVVNARVDNARCGLCGGVLAVTGGERDEEQNERRSN